MKMKIVLSSLIFAITATAAHAESVCKDAAEKVAKQYSDERFAGKASFKEALDEKPGADCPQCMTRHFEIWTVSFDDTYGTRMGRAGLEVTFNKDFRCALGVLKAPMYAPQN